MLKKIALATAIAAVASSAFAMEALDEETLSATTGQAGLTITTTTDVTIAALRYTDNDGSGAAGSAAFDAIAGYNVAGAAMTPPRAAMSAHTTQGTLMVEDLRIWSTGGNITTTLDVGSADATTGKTSLFVTSSISGLNVEMGRISLDNGAVLSYDTTANSGAGATTANNGGAAFGAVSLTDISLSNSKMQITPGGATDTTGITIKSLAPMDVRLDFSFTDDGNSISLAGVANDRGITIAGMDTGTMNVDVVAGGLQLTQGKTTIQSVRLGSNDSGIRLGGNSIGQVGLIGVNMEASTLTVRGH